MGIPADAAYPALQSALGSIVRESSRDTLPDYMIHLRKPAAIDGSSINNERAWVEATRTSGTDSGP
jgi:hypothetical protein